MNKFVQYLPLVLKLGSYLVREHNRILKEKIKCFRAFSFLYVSDFSNLRSVLRYH